MTDFTAYRHPVLAVACPTCQREAGRLCVRPSEHEIPFGDFHVARRREADRVFIEQHGELAAIDRTPGGWVVDPRGREKAGRQVA